jgi:hypothetical protein
MIFIVILSRSFLVINLSMSKFDLIGYHIQVKLPAEPEDTLKRPAYIIHNNAGVPTCENRLVDDRWSCRDLYTRS